MRTKFIAQLDLSQSGGKNHIANALLIIQLKFLSIMTFVQNKKKKNFDRTTQVEDSGDQIQKEPAGKRRKKRWILQEYTGSHRNMEAVFRPENFRIFSDNFRPVPGGKAQESDRNAPEKIQKFSGRNTASMFR